MDGVSRLALARASLKDAENFLEEVLRIEKRVGRTSEEARRFSFVVEAARDRVALRRERVDQVRRSTETANAVVAPLVLAFAAGPVPVIETATARAVKAIEAIDPRGWDLVGVNDIVSEVIEGLDLGQAWARHSRGDDLTRLRSRRKVIEALDGFADRFEAENRGVSARRTATGEIRLIEDGSGVPQGIDIPCRHEAWRALRWEGTVIVRGGFRPATLADWEKAWASAPRCGCVEKTQARLKAGEISPAEANSILGLDFANVAWE